MTPAPVPRDHFDFVLIGAGTVGTAVSALLQRADHRLTGIASRSKASAERAARYLDAPILERDAGLPEGTEVVLVGAPGAAIPEIAERVAATMSLPLVAWHLAGALGIEPLGPVIERGGAGCALHPMQTCPDADTALRRLPGSAWGVTCSEGLSEWAAEVVRRDLEGTAVELDESQRVLWHAAASLTSNGVAALLAEGEAMLRILGIARPEAILGPLAAGTVTNAREVGGGAAALTGPIVRGESRTLQMHLDALASDAPELMHPYALTARLIVDAAARVGRLTEAGSRELSSILKTT